MMFRCVPSVAMLFVWRRLFLPMKTEVFEKDVPKEKRRVKAAVRKSASKRRRADDDVHEV